MDLAGGLPANPNIRTDGSRDEDLDALVGVAGAGASHGSFMVEPGVMLKIFTWMMMPPVFFLWCLVGSRQCNVLSTGEGYPRSSSTHSF